MAAGDAPLEAPKGRAADLRERLATAFLVGPLVLVIAYFGGPVFTTIIALSAALLFAEWDAMSRKTARDRSMVIATAAIAAAGLLAGFQEWALAFIVLGVSALIAMNLREEPRDRMWLLAGMAYAAIAGFALIALRENTVDGRGAVLWLLTTVWAADSGAYAAGRLIGGPKLMPQISPKKTWAGFLGGVLAAVIWSFLFTRVTGFQWIIGSAVSAVAVAVVAQYGDLFESWVKRRFGRKDSGTVFPGHGGMMDRVDALIAATILVAVLNTLGVGFVTETVSDLP